MVGNGLSDTRTLAKGAATPHAATHAGTAAKLVADVAAAAAAAPPRSDWIGSTTLEVRRRRLGTSELGDLPLRVCTALDFGIERGEGLVGKALLTKARHARAAMGSRQDVLILWLYLKLSIVVP